MRAGDTHADANTSANPTNVDAWAEASQVTPARKDVRAPSLGPDTRVGGMLFGVGLMLEKRPEGLGRENWADTPEAARAMATMLKGHTRGQQQYGSPTTACGALGITCVCDMSQRHREPAERGARRFPSAARSTTIHLSHRCAAGKRTDERLPRAALSYGKQRPLIDGTEDSLDVTAANDVQPTCGEHCSLSYVTTVAVPCGERMSHSSTFRHALYLQKQRSLGQRPAVSSCGSGSCAVPHSIGGMRNVT